MAKHSSAGPVLPSHTSPPLPLSGKKVGKGGRLVAWADNEPRRQNLLQRWWGKLTDASTGSPSDGLAGGTSEGSVSVAAFLPSLQRKDTLGGGVMNEDEQDWQVDQVVVEREERIGGRHGTATGSRTAQTATDRSPQAGTGDDTRSAYDDEEEGPKGVMERTWRALGAFFDPHFADPDAESEFNKEQWYRTKKLLFFAVVYLYINWILYLIFNHSYTLYEKIVYYGGLTFVTLPLPFLLFFGMPRSHPKTFQFILCVATWYCAYSEVIQIKQCHFYDGNKKACHGKDFLALLFYSTGVPTLVLFSNGGRIFHAGGQLIMLALYLGLVIPNQSIFSRNVISFLIYSIFIQAFHWSREKGERRMFRLNSQLKRAYRAQQKAQISESSANLAKRRFASYIFHEARVPLNCALLAFQNMKTDGVLEESSLEIDALGSSLIMMQKVLNDVLDLQRMDAGKFEDHPQPFNFHQSIQTMMGNVRVATAAKGLTLTVDLDPSIDQLSTQADSNGLYVVGDPMRLQQIVTNLTSNATKFSPCGGVTVRTKLIATPPPHDLTSPVMPISENLSRESTPVNDDEKEKGTNHKETVRASTGPVAEYMTFRLEVSDNGPGISPSDLNEAWLFKPFAQTRVGRVSGEGSGLGLAIVRQIIALSDGRLGITSKKGHGACFWFELTYRLATPAEIVAARSHPVRSTLSAVSTPIPRPFTRLPSSPMDEITEANPVTPTSPTASTLVNLPVEDPLDDEPLECFVVDDDPLTRTLFTRTLQKLGATVQTATNGQECVDMVLGSPPDVPPKHFDLICLDNSMPILNGEDAVRRLRMEGRSDLYVVGCTGNALREDQEAYLRAGANRILPKPILINDLREVLAVARERRRARRLAAGGVHGA